MNLTLQRIDQSPDWTKGILCIGDLKLSTIEQPWRDNQIGHSCVPLGTYDLIPYDSPEHGPTWCLHNPALNIYSGPDVPAGARAYCEIHSANFASQLEGCIAPGTIVGSASDPKSGKEVAAVFNSRAAVADIRFILGPMSRGHTLTIVNAPPVSA